MPTTGHSLLTTVDTVTIRRALPLPLPPPLPDLFLRAGGDSVVRAAAALEPCLGASAGFASTAPPAPPTTPPPPSPLLHERIISRRVPPPGRAYLPPSHGAHGPQGVGDGNNRTQRIAGSHARAGPRSRSPRQGPFPSRGQLLLAAAGLRIGALTAFSLCCLDSRSGGRLWRDSDESKSSVRWILSRDGPR